MLEYDLELDVDFPAHRFRGAVTISGIPEPGPVELDATELGIESAEVAGAATEFRCDSVAHKLLVSRPPASSDPIRITFSGKALEGMQTGLFCCRVGERPALSTQLQAESCRRLLPCFDRPDRKAVFRLRVTTAAGLVVISNMPAEPRPASADRTQWEFAPTPPMSTYLLYLGIGPFDEYVDTEGPTRVLIAGPPGKRPQMERAARLSRTILRGFTEFFDVPYPLPKLHLIALREFWAGMENWGAITGREDMYLLNESDSPVVITSGESVIAHEIAHQWFGNLVTLRTWDDMWLNEAFATFAVPLVQELTHQRRDPWADFVMKTHRGFRFDSLRCTHSVKPPTCDADEILAFADEITYLKGARLVRMIQAFVGPDRFRDGISEYLRDHAYGNASSDDLWAALGEESQSPVTRVMRSWAERPGHPCITVRQVGPDVELTQHRFALLPGNAAEAPWPIPLTVVEADDRRAVVFDTERLALPGRDASKLTLDPSRTGFFRILWAPELRPRVLEELALASPEDRCGFAEDAEGFLLSGDYTLDDYVAMLARFTLATDWLTAESVVQALDQFEPILYDVPRFIEAARLFCTSQAERLTERAAPGESESVAVARAEIYWMRVRLDPRYSATLAARFASYEREPPALRQAIFSAFARHAGPGSAARLMELVRHPEHEASILASFGLGTSPEITEVLRDLDADLASVPMINLCAYLLPSLCRNPAARPALWEWLTRNLSELERRSTGSPALVVGLSRILPLLGIGRESEVHAFCDRHTFPAVQPGIVRGLELLDAYSRLRARVAAAPADR
jgi:tricorn protease interacting factor F2/3